MARVTMYSTVWCPFCVRAEALLHSKGVSEIDKIDIGHDDAKREAMIALTGRRTVPQVFIGDTHVGGFDDLDALNQDGGLDSLLSEKR